MGCDTPKPHLVAGLGNPLMHDEGVGIRIVNKLKERHDDAQDVDFLDAGTGGVALIHAMEGREKVIFIDCARMGEEAGTIRRFDVHEVRSNKNLPDISLHEADLVEIIGLAKQIGQCPSKITIFGIEPQSVEPSQGLSEKLARRIHEYIGKVEAEIAFLGNGCAE